MIAKLIKGQTYVYNNTFFKKDREISISENDYKYLKNNDMFEFKEEKKVRATAGQRSKTKQESLIGDK